MPYTIINKNTDIFFQEISRRIHRLQSGGTIDSLKEIGADTTGQLGASYVSLKQLASNYTPNEQLATLLWGQRKREEQIIACLLFPEDTNREKITQLMPDCLSFEIGGYMGSLYLYKRHDLELISKAWSVSGNPYQQLAVLTALARHVIIYKNDSKISKEFFKSILQFDYKDKYVQLAAERYRFNI